MAVGEIVDLVVTCDYVVLLFSGYKNHGSVIFKVSNCLFLIL